MTLTRRGLMAALAAALPGKPQRRHPVGWGNNVFPFLIVVGTDGGVFVYDGSNNLIGSVASLPNVDPLTKSNLPGVVSYLPGFSFAQLYQAALMLGSLSNSSKVTADGSLTFNDALFNNFPPSVVLQSPATSAGGVVSLTLQGESVDASQPAFSKFVGSMGVGPASGKIREWWVPVGTSADRVAINTALANGYDVDVAPGVVGVDASLNLKGGNRLYGPPGAVLTPLANLATGIVLISGTNNRVDGFEYVPNGFTADAVQVASGANRWFVDNGIAVNVKGLVVNVPAITGATHGEIGKMLATGCNGGIAVANGGSGTAEISIAQCNIQSCQSAPVLALTSVTDVSVSDLNGAVAGGAGVPAVHIQGNCQSCQFDLLDIGGDSAATGVGTFQIDAAGGNPSEIDVANSVFQGGDLGVLLNAGNRLGFTRVMAKRSQHSNWVISAQTGSGGQGILMQGCAENTGAQAGAGGEGVIVTDASHVGIFGFTYASTGTTFSRALIAGNNVTDSGSTNPGGVAANANGPNGW